MVPKTSKSKDTKKTEDLERVDELTKVILLTMAADENQPIYGKTRLIKVLFLVIQELFPDLVDKAAFFPHHFGPYSAEVAKRLNELLDKKLLTVQKKSNDWAFQLSKEGIEFAYHLGLNESGKMDEQTMKKVQQIRKRLANKSVKQILNLLYTEYPEYAVKSRVLEEVYGKVT